MARAYELFGSNKRVNILKKVKVNGIWKLCPAVMEPNGKLKDRVKVNGHIEVHTEGVYYLEWRDQGQRVRESVRDRADVLRRARLKALQLDTGEAGTVIAATASGEGRILSIPPARLSTAGEFSANPAQATSGTHFILQAIETYIQRVVRSAVASQLSAPALDPPPTDEPFAPELQAVNGHTSQPIGIRSGVPDSDVTRSLESKKTPIVQAVESYLRDIEPPQREQKTYNKYRSTLYLFRDSCKKEWLEDITREDCLSFVRYLYSIGNAPRTAHNRITIILQLLKLHGITGLLKGRDKPKYVENMREMYQPDDLEALFKACDADERVRYLFFLLTGERDEEVQHTNWDDIDFVRQCVRVTEKKTFGFKPKDKEEREIPVPVALLQALKEYKGHQSGPSTHNLVFPTSNGRPDKKFENKLKKIAYRAGLNCGRCISRFNHRCSSGPHCSKWFLHKFRHTFATVCLENGVSIRSLQEWLGHSDLESTMAYLKYVRRKDIHQLVDSTELASFVASSVPVAK
ncbi:MAG TPA: site-specific integrase [Candidatus Angelobacter sp.]